jgi:hypothetical protein
MFKNPPRFVNGVYEKGFALCVPSRLNDIHFSSGLEAGEKGIKGADRI